MSEALALRRLQDFEGVWEISRTIQALKSADAVFEGKATWTPLEAGLQYKETGVMQLQGHAPMQAERRYFWSDDLSVYFDDGRFFHRVPRHGGEARHWCAPDSYVVTYDFADWPRFDVVWQVKGPRKNYRSTTHYMRC